MFGNGDDPLKFDDSDLPGSSDEGKPEMPSDLEGFESPMGPGDDFELQTESEPEMDQGVPRTSGDEAPSGPAAAKAKPPKKKKERSQGPSLFARLRQTSPYVVLLGISVLAVLLAVGILFLELWQYQFEFRPQI